MAFPGAFLAEYLVLSDVRYVSTLARNIIVSSYDNQPAGVCLLADARQSRSRPPFLPTRCLQACPPPEPSPGNSKGESRLFTSFIHLMAVAVLPLFRFPSAGWRKAGALSPLGRQHLNNKSKLVCLVLYEISTQCPKSSYTAALPAADPKRCCSLSRLAALSPKGLS
jgi:hypothetical protein